MSDMTDFQFGMGYGTEGLAYAKRRWAPPNPRTMTDAHLANAIAYWKRNSTPEASRYVEQLSAEQSRRLSAAVPLPSPETAGGTP